MQAYPNVKIIQGAVPFSFEQACPEKVAFLHLDVNSAKAETMALERLFDRVCAGGVIVMDDYGWQNYRETFLAHRQFMAQRGYQVLELATGQGLVVKH